MDKRKEEEDWETNKFLREGEIAKEIESKRERGAANRMQP